jgi:hypothetical protein
MRQGSIQLKHELIGHEKKEFVKREAKKIAKHPRRMKNIADSLALPVGFTRRECLLVSNYPTITKNSMRSRTQRID